MPQTPNAMSDARTRLLLLLRERSYMEGDFILSSGKRSTFYVDMKKTTYDARGRELLGAAIADWLEQEQLAPDSIGGLTLGADAIAHAVGTELHRRGRAVREASVRKSPKDHGRMRLIEGNFEPGDRVLVLDDVVTTGESTIRAIDAFRTEGGTVLAALAIVDRKQGGNENIAARDVRFAALFTIDELKNAPAQRSPAAGAAPV
jgi:orotate phosphoribosyltransferase